MQTVERMKTLKAMQPFYIFLLLRHLWVYQCLRFRLCKARQDP